MDDMKPRRAADAPSHKALQPLCVDVKQGSAALGVSAWVFRRWIAEGRIPTVQFPSTKYVDEKSRRVLVAVADLEKFVAACREAGR